MKVAIVTWITYNNYGTLLQAYSLQHFLSENGIDNDIIYDSTLLYGGLDVSVNKSIRQSGILNAIHYYKKLINKSYTYYRDYQSKNVCEKSIALCRKFKLDNLKINYVKCVDDYPKLNNEYDLFVCGSDQIWSVYDQNFNGYFFLDFVQKPKVSYAASIGTTDISISKKTKIQGWLDSFYKVSVREKASAVQLTELLKRDVKWVVDPTLLYDEKLWKQFCKRSKLKVRGKYILCYFLENKNWYFTYAQKLSEYLNIKFIVLPNREDYLKNNTLLNRPVGPIEFVSLFSGASFVLTDSYHGSIFSLIFEKNFLNLLRFKDNDPINQNIRIESLFEKLNIKDHIVIEKDFEPNDICKTEYSMINGVLSNMREKSYEFLLNSICINDNYN